MCMEVIPRLPWPRTEEGDQVSPDPDDSELVDLGQASRLTAGGPVGVLLESAVQPFSYRLGD
jgi:hypothetical protein